jgi:hypothetical protein
MTTRGLSLAGALALDERGIFTIQNPTTRRLSSALGPERHVDPIELSERYELDPPTSIVRERRGAGHSIAVRNLVATVAAISAALAFALPATASSTTTVDPCAKKYPAVPYVSNGRLRPPVPLHPLTLGYAKCVWGRS